MTFSKLNESAESGKWISNIYPRKEGKKHHHITAGNQTKNTKNIKKQKKKRKKDLKICCQAASQATFPAGRPGLKVEKNETFMSASRPSPWRQSFIHIDIDIFDIYIQGYMRPAEGAIFFSIKRLSWQLPTGRAKWRA